MPYCTNCGSEVSQFAINCQSCGKPQNNVRQQPNSVQPDNGGFGWGLLGFCVPIAGLILFLVWSNERPRTAKAAGLGALIGVISAVVFYILYFVLMIFMIGQGY